MCIFCPLSAYNAWADPLFIKMYLSTMHAIVDQNLKVEIVLAQNILNENPNGILWSPSEHYSYMANGFWSLLEKIYIKY